MEHKTLLQKIFACSFLHGWLGFSLDLSTIEPSYLNTIAYVLDMSGGICNKFIKEGASCHDPGFTSCGCEPGTKCVYYPSPKGSLIAIPDLPMGKRDFFFRKCWFVSLSFTNVYCSSHPKSPERKKIDARAHKAEWSELQISPVLSHNQCFYDPCIRAGGQFSILFQGRANLSVRSQRRTEDQTPKTRPNIYMLLLLHWINIWNGQAGAVGFHWVLYCLVQ